MATLRVILDSAEKQLGEETWIGTCRAFGEAERGGPPVRDQLFILAARALDRCRVTGQLTSAEINTLVRFGESGPPNANSALRVQWNRGLTILDQEMCRMAMPSAPPPMAPYFFYGANGTPFINAAEAFFWCLDCLDARSEGSKAQASLKVGRPCEPDDVVNALRRIKLSPVHVRTVAAWGKKRCAPEPGSQARQHWDEAMALLGAELQSRGIVRKRGEMPTGAVFGRRESARGELVQGIGERAPSHPRPRIVSPDGPARGERLAAERLPDGYLPNVKATIEKADGREVAIVLVKSQRFPPCRRLAGG